MAVKLSIKLEETSVNIAGNYSKVRARVYANSDYGSFNNSAQPGFLNINGSKLNFKHNFKANTTTLLYDVTRTISHNQDGKKELYADASYTTGVSAGTVKANAHLTLKNIPRQSVIKPFTNNFDVEKPIKIYLTQYASSYTQNLKISLNDNTLIKTINDVRNGEEFTFTQQELEAIFSKNVNTKSVGFKLNLTTYSGNTRIGETNETSTGLITNASPTITEFTAKDTDARVLALTGNNQQYIKDFSNMEFNVKAITQKKAVIDHFAVINEIVKPTISGTNFVGTGVVNDINQDVINIYAIDSRGYSFIQPFTPNYIDYFKIKKGSNEGTRNNSVEEGITINFNGEFWNKQFGAGTKNTLKTRYEYKNTFNSSWIRGTTPINLTINGNNFSFNGGLKGDTPVGFDINNSYNLRVYVSDELSEIMYDYVIPSGKPAIAIYKNNVALGAPYDESLGGTQFNGELFHDGKRFSDEYLSGEEFVFKDSVPLNGHITSGATTIYAHLVLPKKISNITTIKSNNFNIVPRGVKGYVSNISNYVNVASSSEYTTKFFAVSDNMIKIEIKKSSAFTNVINNTPVTIQISGNSSIQFE